MNKQELIDKVSFVLDENGHRELQLYGFVSGNDNPFRIGIAPELECQLVEVIAAGVKTLIVDKDYEIVNFSTADERKNRYYQYDLDETPERMANMSFVIGNHNVEMFDLNAHSITEINTLIVMLSDGAGRTFTVYKFLSPVEKMVKSTKMILAKFGIGDDVLTEESQPLLRIGPRFQIVFTDDTYVFLESSAVESQFDLHQVLNNQATRDLGIIENTHLLKDIAKLQHYTEKTSFSRKLVGVMKSSKVIKDNISKDRIIEFISNDEELRGELKFVEVDGERFIDITSQKSAKRFLDLLNDEFVYSSLTGQKYQAVDKDER